MADRKKAEQLPKPLPSIDTPEGRREVLKRARAGDEAVRGLAQTLFDQSMQKSGEWFKTYSNIFDFACMAIIELAAGDDIAVQEACRRRISAVSAELTGPNPDPLERLLCERVALCWFDAHRTDLGYAKQTGMSIEAADYREARRDRAHRRFLAACTTLAKVRRLGLPGVQINQIVNRQQVNVSGSPS